MDQKKQDMPLKDVMLEEAIELIKKSGIVSWPLITKHFKVGYARTVRLLNQIEKEGIVGPSMDDSGSRDILIEHKHEKEVWKNEGNR